MEFLGIPLHKNSIIQTPNKNSPNSIISRKIWPKHSKNNKIQQNQDKEEYSFSDPKTWTKSKHLKTAHHMQKLKQVLLIVRRKI